MGRSEFNFDKEKYLKIMKSQGVQAALTALHQDTNQWEIYTFEGEKGYQPQIWQELEKVREFSRSLWDLSAVNGLGSYKHKK